MNASPQTDDWTEEKSIQLIREYRARPILWDPLDPLFYKKTIQSAVWDDIAHVVNVDREQCKRKMNAMIRRLRKEKEKLFEIIRNESGEPERKYTSSWFAFKEIAFILDIDTERKRRLDGVPIHDGELSIKMTMTKRKIQPHRRTIDTRPTVTGSTDAIPLKRNKKVEETVDSGASTSSRVLPDRDEEIKSFTTFIGNKMRKYTDEVRTAVQQAICDIIFQADQNYYENKVLPNINRDTFQTDFDTEQYKDIKKEDDSYSDSE